MGGTRVKLGFIEEGKLLFTSKLEAQPDKDIEENLNIVSHEVQRLLNSHSVSRRELGGIGISFPCIVDSHSNRVLSNYVKYKDAHQFDFNAWADEHWDLPIVIENDARAALLGEWIHGAGKGYKNIVLLTLGTGVGSAVLNEGQLLRGKNYLAGNMAGHMSINMAGHACNCGFFGCLETEASTWALPEKAARHPLYSQSTLSHIGQPEFSHLFQEADNGDTLAKHLLQDCLKAWGVCAVNMVHAYDPEVIIIGGGIMKREEYILPYVQQMVDKYAWLSPGTTKILAAQQVEYAGLLGMDYLVSRLNIGVS